MNRTIKFRGKRADNKEWVYGYYVVDPLGRHRIYLKPFDDATTNTFFFILSKTVGQFTGLLDKNGKEVYEGDVLNIDEIHSSFGKNKWIVFYDDSAFQVKPTKTIGRVSLVKFMYDAYEYDVIKHIEDISELLSVIGNIYDNPELIQN